MNPFFSTQYDASPTGHFGEFGGRYAPEMLIPALEELTHTYLEAREDQDFLQELQFYYKTYLGRPTPLYFAQNLTKDLGGAKIYLKNEGLNHTGAHKMNHCLGQALLARKMGKKRLIADTGAGQHGVATATVAARFGFDCTIFMGEIDYKRQRPNVFWMQQLGAEVRPVTTGTKRLKDAVNECMKEWIATVEDTHFLLGSCVGPHPYPSLNRDFQSIIGLEIKKQLQQDHHLKKPDLVIACVGGGSNSMGAFNAFLDDPEVKLVAVEAGGQDVKQLGKHAARFQGGKVGVIEGYKSFFLQDEDGQVSPTQSVSAGLDYSGISPQIAHLVLQKRVEISYATDDKVLQAAMTLAKKEGIIPALESAHAVAEAIQRAPDLSPDSSIVVNISGRGDKDIFIIAEALQDQGWKEYLISKAQT